MDSLTALLVCDDVDETAVLRLVLQRSGMSVAHAESVERALALTPPPDGQPVVILLATRRGSPRTQVLQARRDRNGFLVVVTGSSDEDDLVQAYEAGADLVVTRPYSARLLAAQLRAQTRRRCGAAVAMLPSLVVGSVRLDPTGRMVQVGSRPQRRLTQLEFRLLQTLMQYAGQTVPTGTIVERVWGFDGAGGMELVRGLVRRLRGKVEADARRPQYIVTDPGIGYRLEEPDR